MKIQSFFCLLAVAVVFNLSLAIGPLFGDAAQPVRVVCIGDSITQGRGDHSKSGQAWPSTDGWRYAFWKLSVDNDVPIQFVGTMTEGFETTPVYPDYKGQKFDNRHEARWGWTTEGVFTKLKEVQSQWTADLALIYLGTNKEKLSEAEKATDPDAIARTTAAMQGIIQLLQQNNPKMSILIQELGGSDARSKGVNAAYEKLATDLSTSTSKIAVVAPAQGWQWDPKQPNSDTVDGCHPTKSGDAKIAADFWKAYRALSN